MTAPGTGDAVSLYVDASCPWTWNTSRWLVEVAAERHLTVTWRTFCLDVADEGRVVPERRRASRAAGRAASRIVEVLRAEAGNDDVGRFYRELGRRWHHDGGDRTVEVALAALGAAGLAAHAGAAADASWDGALRASIDEALALTGPDVGSPVLRIGDRAMFGPIVSPPPVGVDALALWDAVRIMVAAEGVYELKRGRSGGARPGARP